MAALEIDRGAATERIPLGDGSSWVDLTPGLVREPEPLLETVIAATPWTQTEVWRYDRFVPERRLGALVRPDALPPPLRQAGLHIEAAYRRRFSGAAVIHYRDGSDFQGLHADREMRWLEDTLIAIVVLGADRPFVLRPRRNVNDPDARSNASGDVVLRPGRGDLLVMGGRCQADWLHGVPPAPGAGPRVSVTWRWTSRRGRPDTNPGYFEGRHFSDRPGPAGRRSRPVG